MLNRCQPRRPSTAIRVLSNRLALYVERHPDAPAEPRRLSLRLTVPQRPTRAGEPMRVELGLENTGTAPVTVNGRMALNTVHAPDAYREVVFEIRRPDGALLPFLPKLRIGAATAADLVELAPGASLRRSYELSTSFGLDVPGSYGIRALYASAPVADLAGRPAWTASLGTAWMPFERIAAAH